MTQGVNLVEAAKSAGVSQFVHTSVTGAGQHAETPGWADTDWGAVKLALPAQERDLGPGPRGRLRQLDAAQAGFLHGELAARHGLPVPRGIEGAEAAIAAPERFHGVELELASDQLTMT